MDDRRPVDIGMAGVLYWRALPIPVTPLAPVFMMIRSTVLLAALLFASCAAREDLTPGQLAKIDPKLRVLLEQNNVPDASYEITFRPDGSREYSVIVYGSNPDTLRTLGIPLQTVLGEMMTARVTVAELRILAVQPSVRSVLNAARAFPH